MILRIALALAFAAACWGADKKLPEGKTSNPSLEITAAVYLDKDDIKKLLGSDLDGYIIVVDVRLVPKPGSKLAVTRDDFILRSDKDGQRAGPFHPSQIAGGASMVISSAGNGSVRAENPGPVWRPPLGGPPVRMGTDGPLIGNAPGDTQAAVSSSGKVKEDPVLTVLKEKVLPEKEIAEPLSGLLYFFLDGKHKPKDLELLYNGPAGKLSLRFKN